MNRLLKAASALVCAVGLTAFTYGQAIPYVPRAAAAFISPNGTGAVGSWGPLQGAGSLPIDYVPYATGIYVSTDGTGKVGTWVPWTGAGGGGANPLTVEAEWTFSEGTGTKVADITGHGHDAQFCTSTAAPAWGVDGVHFLNSTTAINPFQCVTTNVQTWTSMAIAYEIYVGATTTGIGGLSTPYNNFPSIFGTTAANSGVFIMSGCSAGGYGPPNIGAFQPTIFRAGAAPVTCAAGGFGQRHIMEIVAGSPDAIYIDGVLQSLAVSGSSTAFMTSTGTYMFGSGPLGNNNGFRGTVLYAALSTSAWTPTQVIQENNYIRDKIAQRPLTTWQTGTTRTPTVIFAGDSLLASRAGTGVWTSVLTLNNTYTVINRGVSGKLAYDVDKLAESEWMKDASPNAKTYVIFDGGSNDDSGGASAENIWASIQDYVTQAKKVGAIPIASTLISRTGRDTQIAAINALIRARWKQAGFAALLDNWERPEFATGGSTNLTYYQSDGTHGTGGTVCSVATGYGLFCVGASKIINTLDGSSAANPDLTVSNAYVEADANNYIVQTPTAAATHQLVDCSWISGLSKTVVNGSASFTITMSTTASQTIAGKLTVAPNSSGIFTAVPTGNAGGCSWVGQ